MACRVKDKIFKGFDGQLIGVFTIPIGDIMAAQRKEFLENKFDLDYLIEELTKIRDGKGVQSYRAVDQ